MQRLINSKYYSSHKLVFWVIIFINRLQILYKCYWIHFDLEFRIKSAKWSHSSSTTVDLPRTYPSLLPNPLRRSSTLQRTHESVDHSKWWGSDKPCCSPRACGIVGPLSSDLCFLRLHLLNVKEETKCV